MHAVACALADDTICCPAVPVDAGVGGGTGSIQGANDAIGVAAAIHATAGGATIPVYAGGMLWPSAPGEKCAKDRVVRANGVDTEGIAVELGAGLKGRGAICGGRIRFEANVRIVAAGAEV